jgi:hypothetical protein
MAEITRLEKITKDSMVPTISGGFVEQEFEGYAWRCEGCGLVWTRKGHAEQCESKGHEDHVVYGPYGVVAVENGKLVGEPKYYTHYAIRRDKVAKVAKGKPAKKAAAVKQEPKVNVKAEALERIAVLIGAHTDELLIGVGKWSAEDITELGAALATTVAHFQQRAKQLREEAK